MDPLIGKVFNDYQIDDTIGHGNVASVYRAHHLQSGAIGVIKILNSRYTQHLSFQEHFKREANSFTRFQHQNILRVLAAGQQGDYLYFVTDYAPYGSLRQWLDAHKTRGVLPKVDDILTLGIQIASGLHYAHDQRILHENLKPENILLTDPAPQSDFPYRVLLSDLGVYQMIRAGLNSELPNPSDDLPYLAPEIAANEPVSYEADIYSLGTLLYLLAVGYPPFEPKSFAEAVVMHKERPVTPIHSYRSAFPVDLEDVILICLEKVPQNRFRSAISLQRELEDLRQRLSHQYSTQVPPRGHTQAETVPNEETLSSPATQYTQPPIDLSTTHDRIVVIGKQPPTTSYLIEDGITLVGRDKNANITLDSEHVSRFHVRIEQHHSADGTRAYTVTDMGSSNGSWLGNTLLEPNVATAWQAGTALYIDVFKLMLEPRASLAITQQYIIPVKDDAPDKKQEDTQELAPLQIRVTLAPYRITVAPGTVQNAVLDIQKLSDIVEHFNITILDIPATWFEIPTSSIRMDEIVENSVTINFNPPRDSTSTAGLHPFRIVISSRRQANSYPFVVEGQLNILPYYDFNIDVHPKRIRRGKPTQLTIRNVGNTAQPFQVVARDQEDALLFGLQPARLTVVAGNASTVAIQPRPRRRVIFGRVETKQFEVTATDTHQDESKDVVGLEYQNPPIFRTYMLVLAGIALLLCVVACICSVVAYSFRQNAAATQAATDAIITQEAQTQAILASDADGDGLSNGYEVIINTNPNSVDTDGDGLGDQDELCIHLTSPLQRDTDGDGLEDGVEVNGGTSPRDFDTARNGERDQAGEVVNFLTPVPLNDPICR